MNFSDVPISGDFWCICFALVVGVQSPGPSVSGVRRVGHGPTDYPRWASVSRAA